MKERNKRIKTDYSKSTTPKNAMFISKIRDDRSSLQKRVSSLGDQFLFISRILQSINHDSNYKSTDEAQLMKERESFKNKIKQMKEALAFMLGRQMQKKNQQQRVQNKAMFGKEMGMDYDTISKECLQNRQTIAVLEQQFKENNQRLASVWHPNSNLSRERIVSQAEEKVKEMKKLMSRMKKNKFLREREIVKGKGKQVSELQLLQHEYRTLTKKEEFLVQRLQTVQQELADIDFNFSQQKQYYNEVKYQFDCFSLAQQSKEEKRIEEIYSGKKRKYELNWKRNEREEENAKRKYYELLKDFQTQKQRIQQIHNKIFITTKQNQVLLTNIERHFKKYQVNKSRIGKVREKTLLAGKSLAEVAVISKKENSIKESVGNKSNINSDSSFQHKLNQINVNDRKLIRKWNIPEDRDSTKLSNISLLRQHKMEENLMRENADFNKLGSSKQILHIRTQSTPNFDNETIVQSEITFIEEEYSQEFTNKE